MVFTLCWTDPAGTPVSAQVDPSDPMLVNDLDITVTSSSRTIFYPWKLDGNNPENAATKTGENNVDNVEKIEIPNTVAGENYTVTITHDGTLSSGSQDYSLIISGISFVSPSISVNPTLFSETLGLNANQQSSLSITNSGDNGSILSYNIIIEENDERDISGSTFTSTETEYESNTAFDLHLSIYNASTDLDWIDEATLNFPDGVTVTSSTNFVGGSNGDLTTNNTTGNGAIITWSDANGDWGNIKDEETAIATVNISIASDFSGDLSIPWTLSGDDYGDAPHDINGTITLSEIHSTVDWLSINQNSGSLNQGDSDNLILTFNSSGLSAGTYNANIKISSNDPNEAVKTIPVTLIVADNSSSGSNDNGDGSGSADVDMPITNIDGNAVDPDVSIDPEGDVGITINVTVTDDVQGSTPVTYPEQVIISYDVEIIGAINGVNLVFDLDFSGLSNISQIYWLNGTNWEVPNNVNWSTPNHVLFNLDLLDRDSSTEIILSEDAPLPVTLSSFAAIYSDGYPILSWTTQSESNNLGWNIYRAQSNIFAYANILNIEFIPGNGTTSEPSTYTFTDEEDVQNNAAYWYWLENIDLNGSSKLFGPINLIIEGIPEDDASPEIPYITEIQQNFPNPFNPSTSIQYTLSTQSEVLIEIFNIKGQYIRTFNEGIKSQGSHSIYWDGLDNNSNPVGTGIYLFKMKTNNYSGIKKGLLIK